MAPRADYKIVRITRADDATWVVVRFYEGDYQTVPLDEDDPGFPGTRLRYFRTARLDEAVTLRLPAAVPDVAIRASIRGRIQVDHPGHELIDEQKVGPPP